MSWSTVDERPSITPTVQALIAANVAVLFVQWTLIGDADTFRWLGYSDGALLSRWWTVGSYMFVHGGLLHLALNMYSLWLFGPRLEAAWGAPRFAALYAWCGLGGVALHAVFGGAGLLVGASGAVFGVMLAYALTWPDDEILFFGVIPMRVMTLVMVLGALNLLQGFTYAGSGVAHFAHLGGFLFAFVFMRAPGLFGLDRARQRVADLPHEDARPRAIQRPLRPRERAEEVDDVVARSRAAIAETTSRIVAPRPAARSVDSQSEVDRVLDKISASGLDSLSRHERAVLDAYSQRLKQGR